MSSVCLTQQIFSSSVELFLFDRQAKGRTEGTIEYYQDELVRFFAWIETEGISQVELIPSDTIKKFFIDLSKRRNKGGIHCSFRAIKAFFNWYEFEYEPQWKNPIKKVKLPPQKLAPLPEIPLTDIQKLLAVCYGDFQLRDIALLKCLLDTGARASELLALNFEDINNSSVLIRHGKGDKARIVYLGNNARKSLNEYLDTRGELLPDSPLFLNKDQHRLKFYGLREVTVRLTKRAGTQNYGLHSYRRTCALTLYRKTHDILFVSRYLGHSNIEVTKRYLNVGNEELQESFLSVSPADSLE